MQRKIAPYFLRSITNIVVVTLLLFMLKIQNFPFVFMTNSTDLLFIAASVLYNNIFYKFILLLKNAVSGYYCL